MAPPPTSPLAFFASVASMPSNGGDVLMTAVRGGATTPHDRTTTLTIRLFILLRLLEGLVLFNHLRRHGDGDAASSAVMQASQRETAHQALRPML